MSDAWTEPNEEYLAAALAWLRLRLAWLAQDVTPAAWSVPVPAPVAVVPPRRRRWWRIDGDAESAPEPLKALPPGRVPDADVDEAAARMREAEQSDPPPALVVLAEQLGLSAFEANVLLLCVALELDPSIGPLCARAQGTAGTTLPTFGLALHLFDGAAWDVLSPHRPLRHWRLVEIAQPPGQPLTASPLRADERVVNYVKGLNELDDRLDPLVGPPLGPASHDPLPPSQHAVVDEILHRWRQSAADAIPAVALLGTDAGSKIAVAAHATDALGRQLYRMSVELLPQQPADLEATARLWHRESLLLPIALYLDADEATSAGLSRFLAHSDGVFFVAVREMTPGLGRPVVALDVERPTAAEQRDAWVAVLGEDAALVADRLAGQFRLDARTITEIGRGAQADAADGASLETAVWEGCLASTRPRMDALAQRIAPKVTWDDFVLPAADLALLRQLADQVPERTKVYDRWGFAERMSRGFGITALFAGPSGAGKTMAAEVIANHLGLNLYRIDLSAVVSKYIGETEKNLSRLFDAAEAGGALLFFDEADALFSKRSEVKDSHDRYANIEVNYLLQRMESFGGVAILASNMKTALDNAFMRRLRFIVNFSFPAPPERKRMWERVFPVAMPRGALDFDRLAALPATGGTIHNIALNAAFTAAHADEPVTMRVVLASARDEFRKLDLPVVESDFLWNEPARVR